MKTKLDTLSVVHPHREPLCPVAWQKCVTHGDLHGGNIFVDPQSKEVWLIDFARTGERLLVFDLAALELHTKFQLLPALLKTQNLIDDEWSFIHGLLKIEKILAAQTITWDGSGEERLGKYGDNASRLTN